MFGSDISFLPVLKDGSIVTKVTHKTSYFRFFHWLGALITNVGIIGVKSTPVREVVDLAAQSIPNERKAITFVVSSFCASSFY